jgi:hypothetical protein
MGQCTRGFYCPGFSIERSETWARAPQWRRAGFSVSLASIGKEADMENYLFIVGGRRGLNFPVADGQDEAGAPVGVTGFELYIRDSLSVGAEC